MSASDVLSTLPKPKRLLISIAVIPVSRAGDPALLNIAAPAVEGTFVKSLKSPEIATLDNPKISVLASTCPNVIV